MENLKILLVRPEEARDVLPRGLTEMGAIVDEAVAYRTVPEAGVGVEIWELLEREGADWVTFTSGSTARNFLKLPLKLPTGWKAASIGPVTSSVLREHDIEPAAEAADHNLPGLVSALLEAVNVEPPRR